MACSRCKKPIEREDETAEGLIDRFDDTYGPGVRRESSDPTTGDFCWDEPDEELQKGILFLVRNPSEPAICGLEHGREGGPWRLQVLGRRTTRSCSADGDTAVRAQDFIGMGVRRS